MWPIKSLPIFVSLGMLMPAAWAEDHSTGKRPRIQAPAKTEAEIRALVAKAKIEIQLIEQEAAGANRQKLVNEWEKKLRTAQEKSPGEVVGTLFEMLISNESFPLEQDTEFFGTKGQTVDGKTSLARLPQTDATALTLEYTKMRQKNRQEFFKALLAQLEKSDVKAAKPLAKVAEGVVFESLRSYDVAMDRIEVEKLVRPLCFTCHAPLAVNDTDPGLKNEAEIKRRGGDTKGKQYDFYDAMLAAARRAVGLK